MPVLRLDSVSQDKKLASDVRNATGLCRLLRAQACMNVSCPEAPCEGLLQHLRCIDPFTGKSPCRTPGLPNARSSTACALLCRCVHSRHGAFRQRERGHLHDGGCGGRQRRRGPVPARLRREGPPRGRCIRHSCHPRCVSFERMQDLSKGLPYVLRCRVALARASRKVMPPSVLAFGIKLPKAKFLHFCPTSVTTSLRKRL